MIASRLVTLRRPPFAATMTSSFSASLSSVFRFLGPGDRPRGWPDRPFGKRVWRGGLRDPTPHARLFSGGICGLRLAGEGVKALAANAMKNPSAGQRLPTPDDRVG